MSKLKAPRSKFGCVLIDKNMYIIGGKKGKERVNDVEIWTTLTTISNHGSNTLQNRASPDIHADGGWLENTNINGLKKKRSGFGVAIWEHFIYVIGGNDGENILNTVEVLNTENGEWNKV